MKLVLLTLVLTNFKGLRAFKLDLQGRGAEVRGDNGAGKTTLADAWTWLLFGRDSGGRADFAVKTLTKGSTTPGLDHGVEATVEVDGQRMVLSKTFREKWTKKRGAAKAELTGHTTEYAIDGVPMLEKEWRLRLERLCQPETWQLLTTPGGFLAMHWERRRALLMQLVGGISDADVITSEPELAELPVILNGRTPEDHRKVAEAARRKANDRIRDLPGRIDEAARTLPVGLDRAQLSTRLAEVERLLDEAKAGQDLAPRRERAALETQRQELIGQRNREQMAARRQLEDQRDAARTEAASCARQATHWQQMAREVASLAAAREAEAARLRDAYRRISPPVVIDGLCPACGQTLPPAQVEEARQAAQVRYAEQRRANVEQGRAVVAEAARLREQVAEHEAAAERHHAAELQARVAVEQAIAALGSLPTTHPLDEQIAGLAQRIAALDAQLAGAVAPNTAPLETERRQLQADLARLDAAARTLQRIGDLEAEQKKLAVELDRLEHELHLLDVFAAAQATFTEAKVNGRFDLARFRLFRPQINGGVEPCCDVLVDGVPAGAGLNRSAEVNVGLDIIRTLSRHHGLSVPVWLDNAESTVRPIPTGTQMIRLVVDPAAPQLKVEVER